VILLSGTVEDSDRERIEPFAFDHVIEKTGRYGSIEKVAELVEKLLGIQVTEKPEEIKQTQKKAKVIVIDDDLPHVRAVCRMLGSSEELDVPKGLSEVNSFEQAKELIERHSPDIVISDKQIWTVSKGDHLEILRFIQENYPNTKVILSSSAIEEKDQQAGFDAFISKPLDPRKMIAIVEKLARKD
jgi:CheY-like chemotaxis protein